MFTVPLALVRIQLRTIKRISAVPAWFRADYSKLALPQSGTYAMFKAAA